MDLTHKAVVLRNQQTIQKIEYNTIIAIEGNGYCSTFILENSERFTITKNLKQVEEMLITPHIHKG
jgi:hypothetical protein